MPRSPRGRPIIELEGDASTITQRGNDIEQLGGMMRESASTLQTLASRTGEQQGKAITSLQESVGESHQVLAEAADLYEPVGPVIATYGDELSTIKPRLDGHATACESLWSTYQSLPGEIPPRGTGGWGQPDADSPEAESNAEEDGAKQAALEAWESEAGLFDSAFDTWEDAFDTAVEGIGQEMAGSIKDSFWDNWGGVIDFISDALGWAALIVGIAALIFAGPFLAIATALAFAVLAVTVVQAVWGDKNGWDVAIAALGVVPFGKAGMLFQKGQRLNFAKEFVRPLGDFGQFGKIHSLYKMGDSGLLNWGKVAFQNGNQQGAADLLGRLMIGKSATDLSDLNRAVDSSRLVDIGAGLWEFGHGVAGHYLKYEGWVSQITGSDSLKSQLPPLDVLW